MSERKRPQPADRARLVSLAYPVRDDIPVMLIDEARHPAQG